MLKLSVLWLFQVSPKKRGGDFLPLTRRPVAEEAPGDNTKTLCLLLAPCTASTPQKKLGCRPFGQPQAPFPKDCNEGSRSAKPPKGLCPHPFSPCSQPRLWLPLLTLLSPPKAFISSRSWWGRSRSLCSLSMGCGATGMDRAAQASLKPHAGGGSPPNPNLGGGIGLNAFGKSFIQKI